MTQKELLYFEDAISHEDIIIQMLQDNLVSLNDDELITFMNNELNTHQSLKKELLNLLEEKNNG